MSFLISAEKGCHILTRGAASVFLTKEQNAFSWPVHVERKKDRKNVFYLNNATLVFGEASLGVISAPENSEMLPE